MRNLDHARSTPGGPEMQDNDSTLIITERSIHAVEVVARQLGHRLSDGDSNQLTKTKPGHEGQGWLAGDERNWIGNGHAAILVDRVLIGGLCLRQGLAGIDGTCI